MSSLVTAFAAIGASAILIVILCVSNPKRRRAAGTPEWRQTARTRRMLAAAAVLPGVLCILQGDAAAFLMWLGGSVLVGWGAALGIRALSADRS